MAVECGEEGDGRWVAGGDENKAMDIVNNDEQNGGSKFCRGKWEKGIVVSSEHCDLWDAVIDAGEFLTSNVCFCRQGCLADDNYQLIFLMSFINDSLSNKC